MLTCICVSSITKQERRVQSLKTFTYLSMQGMVKSSDSVTRFEPAAITRLTISFSEHVSSVVEVCQAKSSGLSRLLWYTVGGKPTRRNLPCHRSRKLRVNLLQELSGKSPMTPGTSKVPL